MNRERLRRLRLPGRRGGRLAPPGHDYDRGHREYVSTLRSGEVEWLETKPFSAPPGDELAPCLRTFVNVVTRLELGLRAQVLDAGCGPGWLSELLARCGYWVVGVDVSQDMIEIARRRLAAIPRVGGLEPFAEFHAVPVREIPWRDRFDAVILYDAMHHFDQELATLRTLRRALVPGGTLFLREGVRPPPGSADERALLEEMESRGTLESVFDPGYLSHVARAAGFVDVRRFFEVDGLFDLADSRGLARTVLRYAAARAGLAPPPSNTLVARKPPVDGARPAFAARIERVAEPATLRLTNTGRCYWPAAAGVAGTVTVGAWHSLPGGGRRELPRVPLPHAVSPGESVVVEAALPPDARGSVTIDLVREGLARFAEGGSAPLELPL